jgi:hypothetical protein
VTKAMPLYRLWTGIEASFTSGDGYLDELCMEFVGLDSSRSRPLTRDISDAYSERCRAMLKQRGVPRLLPTPMSYPAPFRDPKRHGVTLQHHASTARRGVSYVIAGASSARRMTRARSDSR